MNAPQTPPTLHYPPTSEVRAQLQRLSLKQIDQLAALSGPGVSAHALIKIRNGTVKNPGVETLRKFVGHIQTVQLQPAAPPAAAPVPAPAGG